MLLLEQDTKKKDQVNKLLELVLKLEERSNIKYKIKTIENSVVYAIKTIDQLLGLYYLIF